MTTNEQAIKLTGEIQKVKDNLKTLAYAETAEGRALWAFFSDEVDRMIEEEYRLVAAQYANPLAHSACNRAAMALYRIKQLPKFLTDAANLQIESIGASLDAVKTAQARFEGEQEATSKFDPSVKKES